MSLCECGCGKETNIYRGKHRRFIVGHSACLRKGIPQTEQHKKNRSLATKGIVNKNRHNSLSTEFKKGLVPWNKDVSGCFSKETLEKMSISMKGKVSGDKNGMYDIHRFGTDSPNWKGGKKLSTLRKNTKRRGMEFNSLNESFFGSEAHHVDKNNIIWIPRELNQNIKHNLGSGKNMEVINACAYFFLIQQNILNLNNIFSMVES